MKTDLEIAQKQLELALKEIKSIKGRNVELLYDYVFEAHSLVKKLTIPHVVGRSEQLVCEHPDEAIIRDKPTDYCLACNRNI